MRSLVSRSRKGRDLALRQRSHEAVGRLAVDESDDRGDRLDAHLPGNGGMLVDVHLDELDLALGRLDHLFEDGGELLARATPRRPEIDQHRLALRFLDDVLDETLRRRVLDRRVRGCGSSLLQH